MLCPSFAHTLLACPVHCLPFFFSATFSGLRLLRCFFSPLRPGVFHRRWAPALSVCLSGAAVVSCSRPHHGVVTVSPARASALVGASITSSPFFCRLRGCAARVLPSGTRASSPQSRFATIGQRSSSLVRVLINARTSTTSTLRRSSSSPRRSLASLPFCTLGRGALCYEPRAGVAALISSLPPVAPPRPRAEFLARLTRGANCAQPVTFHVHRLVATNTSGRAAPSMQQRQMRPPAYARRT